MINITRKETAPDCLKKQTDYNCDDVLEKLETDFFGKCYICETNLFSTNIEHFKAHQNDKKLKFEWTNLFLACGHCNNIKSTTEILNCTVPKHDVENKITYKPLYLPANEVKISTTESDELSLNTINILNKVYNGHTKIKKRDGLTLKEYLVEEMLSFHNLILNYSRAKHNKIKLSRMEICIKEELHKGSKLTAFKRQIIKDNTKYHQFKKYFD